MITRENEVAKKGEREIEGKREREREREKIYNLCKNLLTSTPVSKTLHMLNSHAYFWDMFTSQLLSQQCWLSPLSEPQHCLLTGLPPPPPPTPHLHTHLPHSTHKLAHTCTLYTVTAFLFIVYFPCASEASETSTFVD